MTPRRDSYDNDDINASEQHDYDEQQQSEPVFRTSSPPIPTLQNKGKKQKSTVNNVRRQSYDNVNQQKTPTPTVPPLHSNDDFIEAPFPDDINEQSQQTYRKPPTPRQPGL